MMSFVLLVLLAVLATEICCRFAIRSGRYYVFAPYRRDRVEPDPATHPQLERVIQFTVNRCGERGGPPAADAYRILTIGGSAVECYFLDQGTAWPGALEQLLARPEHLRLLHAVGVHVGNIGKSGVDSRSLAYILEKSLGNYAGRLSLILIMVGASDVLRWLEIGAPADRPCDVFGVDEAFARHPEMEFGCSPKSSAMAEVIRRLREMRLEIRIGAGRWYVKARAMRAAAKERRTESADPKIVLEAFDQGFRRVLQICRASARRVIVVRQPWFRKEAYLPEELAVFWNGGVGKAHADDISVYYSEQVISRLMSLIDAHTATICDEAGIEHLELMPLLQPSLQTFTDQFHLTPEASRFVAWCIMKKILRV